MSSASRPVTGQMFGTCGNSYYGASSAGKPPVMRCTNRRHVYREDKCACKQVALEPLEAGV